VNRPPVIGRVPTLTVPEGQPLTFRIGATDANDPESLLVFSLVSAPPGAALAADGTLRWTPADGNATGQFAVRVTDPQGAFDEQRFDVTVTDVAPVLSATGNAQTVVGTGYTLTLGSVDPGFDPPIEWIVDWGDGTPASRVAGTATTASHSFAAAGQFTVRATLRNDDGSFSAAPLGVRARAAPLLISSARIVESALSVRVTTALDPALAGVGAINLVGDRVGAVATRFTLDADGQGFVLVRADGKPFEYDRFDLVLADSGFRSRDGYVLDGDANGLAGGSYRASLLFANPRPGTARLDDFIVPPGRVVDVPVQDRAGLKIQFENEGGVKVMTFTVAYDPALLTVSGVVAGADLPAGARLSYTLLPIVNGKGTVRVTISSDTAIAAGNRWIASLIAAVPETAPYGSDEVLVVRVESINAALPAGGGFDEALQIVGDIGIDFLPRAERPRLRQMPLVPSQAARPPLFAPITYGTQAAVAKWAKDIWMTGSPVIKGPSQSQATPAQGSKAKDAAPTKRSELDHRQSVETAALPDTMTPLVDLNAAPAMLGSTRAAASPAGGVRLGQLLGRGAVTGPQALDKKALDSLFFPIVVPALKPSTDKRRKRRDKADELEDCK